jgi:hypothetical protein
MNLSRFGSLPFRLDGKAQRQLSDSIRAGQARRKGNSMRISDFCFIFAATCALGGMGLGIFMGIVQDFTLAPSHAHVNLLGWVTMALYGLYHRGIGRVSGLAGWLQVGSGALGAALMAVGLGLYLSAGHDERFVPVVIVGSLLALFAMLMFLGLVVTDMLRVRQPAFGTTVHSG